MSELPPPPGESSQSASGESPLPSPPPPPAGPGSEQSSGQSAGSKFASAAGAKAGAAATAARENRARRAEAKKGEREAAGRAKAEKREAAEWEERQAEAEREARLAEAKAAEERKQAAKDAEFEIATASANAGSGQEALATKLSSKTESFVRKRNLLLPGEVIRAAIGSGSQVILATDDRLVVVKVGWTASTTGGGRGTALSYADVSAIQVQLGIISGTLSVQAPGYGATQTGDYWSGKNQQNWQSLPNVIPWSKPLDRQFAAELNYARQRIAEAKAPSAPVASHAPPVVPPDDLSQQLERLVQMHLAGHLSDQEFAFAKSRLLGG